MTPESVRKVTEKVLERFGEKTIDPTLPEYLMIVIHGRNEELGPDSTVHEVTAELQAFVKERLGRCGFDVVKADERSTMEIWDILDDYDFHRIMGRR